MLSCLLQHAQNNEIFYITTGTNEVPAQRCMKHHRSSVTNACNQFYVCPPLINSTDHLCDIMNEPIEEWVADVDIVKISCDGRTQRSSSWKNVTTVQNCDLDWRDVFLSSKNRCKSNGSLAALQKKSNELLKPSVFQGIMWLIGLVAVLGNLFVIILAFHLLKKGRYRLSKVKKIHYILSINLGVADLLMGSYLTILAICSRFSNNSAGLRINLSRSLCNFLGVINVVSSQMSVSIWVIITSFRLYSSFKPFKSPSLTSATAMVCIGWIFWFVAACIPLLNMEKIQSIFVRYVDLSCSNVVSTFPHSTVQDFFKKFEQHARSACKSPSSKLYQLRHTTGEK